MKRFLLGFVALMVMAGCKLSNTNPGQEGNHELAALLDRYYNERMQLYPLEATANGETRYNHLLQIDFTESFRDTLKTFYTKYLADLQHYEREHLNREDRLSYDAFEREVEMNLENLKYKDNLMPFQQFWGLPLSMGQLGSGEGQQPFKTVQDYDNWLQRAARFPAWADSAIVYFRKGMAAGWVLPRALVVRMIPQMRSMQVTDSNSIFMGPAKKFPADIAAADRQRITQSLQQMISGQLVPAYKRLGDFLEQEYLPKARTSTGIGALAGGADFYQFLIRQQTTTELTPDAIYETGVKEVARIQHLQDSVRQAVGFKGDLQAFFQFMRTDKRFMPYKTPQEVINAFEAIHRRIEPNLKKLFTNVPRTPFVIRQTEAFRAATASAEYNQGSPDGTRPGIFYVPILDATQFNQTSGMESLFLHEAIPGHHYQISLQMEDTAMPKFRRFGGNNAYVEGWALYCESLGKELGLYTDPYQYMAALGDEMHRAIRLVVDVGMHAKGMTREQAIAYMMAHEAADEQYATMEIERYMAIPGQALGYKIGALKILEIRHKAQQQLGDKFSLAAFHDEVLKDGALPLNVLERKMEDWSLRQH